ncbi:EF-hand calcium-binding domain-containing protein 7-like isoform X1 [Argonauta hians]
MNSTLSSPQLNTEEEFILDCKASYLSVFNTLEDPINTMDDLILVLQQSGRNPSRKSLEKYKQDLKASLNFDDFCKICSIEPQTTPKDLIEAFLCLDTNGDGLITYDKLLNLMESKGETMSASDTKILMEGLDIDSNGMVDYEKFSKTVGDTIWKTKVKSKKLMNEKLEQCSKTSSDITTEHSVKSSNPHLSSSSQDMMRTRTKSDNFEDDITDESVVIEESIVIGDGDADLVNPTISTNFSNDLQLQRKSRTMLPAVDASTASEPKNIKTWTHLKSCGCFFIENTDITNHHYRLSLPYLAKVWITINPVYGPENHSKHDPLVDTMLCVFKCKSNGAKEFIALSDMKTKDGKFCVECNLSAGHYILVPFTSGCRFHSRSASPTDEIPLIDRSPSGDITLTLAFKESLRKIFDVCDLDKNGKLSRSELSFFHHCTCGEQLTSKEWQIVEERFDLEEGELTPLGFLNLHEMEAEDNNGDTEDLWITLESMGMNRALVLDHAFQFQLNVFLEDCSEALLDVLEVDNGGVDLEKALCKTVINKVNNCFDLFITASQSSSSSLSSSPS